MSNYSFVYTWRIPNYKQDATGGRKGYLESDHFFQADGSEWSLLVRPRGWLGHTQCFTLRLHTEGVVRKVALVAWHVVKGDDSVVLLTQRAGCELGGKSGLSVVCLEHGERLHEKEEFLQSDGSLTLQCHICLDG